MWVCPPSRQGITWCTSHHPAGVVQPGSVEGTGRVGLAAPPRFSYIDGTVSTLPGEGETRFE